MSRIILATANLGFEQRVRRVFDGSLNGELTRWRDQQLIVEPDRAVAELSNSQPELVVLGPDIPIEDALRLASHLDQHRPEISLILTAEPSPDLWQQALGAGVRAIISPEATDHELRKEFDRAIETARTRRNNLIGDAGPGGPHGRVITVVSPKGGAGKTAIATNLAVGLAEARPGEVVLVDLDLQFGDITTALALTPQHSIADVASTKGSLDAATLKVFLGRRKERLFVLCAPDTPAEGERVTEGQVQAALRLLADEFAFVIVDTSAGIGEHTLSALECSTDLLLVCDLSVASVRGLRKIVDALDRLDMTAPARHYILNRADARVGLEAAEATATLGTSIHHKIPSSRLLPLSMNQGVPLMETAPKAPPARALRDLVDVFAEVPAQPTGLLGRIKSR